MSPDKVSSDRRIKVSVITVCFNSCETIRRTVESVLSQTGVDLEYIIIDGVSTDGTLNILHENKCDLMKVVSGPDLGIYDAMNKGIDTATGDVIHLLNSDDYYCEPTSLAQAVDLLEAGKLNYCDMLKVSATKRELYSYDLTNPRDLDVRCGIIQPTWLVWSSIYKKVGRYSLNWYCRHRWKSD